MSENISSIEFEYTEFTRFHINSTCKSLALSVSGYISKFFIKGLYRLKFIQAYHYPNRVF